MEEDRQGIGPRKTETIYSPKRKEKKIVGGSIPLKRANPSRIKGGKYENDTAVELEKAITQSLRKRNESPGL